MHLLRNFISCEITGIIMNVAKIDNNFPFKFINELYIKWYMLGDD